MLLLLLAPLAAAAPPTQAPADHCALYEVIHREQLSSRNHLDHGVALRAAAGVGRNLTCPGWKLWPAAPTEVYVFEPPAFSSRGKRASVAYTLLSYNHHWDVLRITSRTRFTCEMERVRTGWRITACSKSAERE